MISHPDRLTLKAVLLGAMTFAAPSWAVAQGEGEKPEGETPMAEPGATPTLQEQLDALSKIVEQFSALEKRFNEDVTKNSNQLTKLDLDMLELKKQVGDIQTQLDAMRDRLASESKKVGSSPLGETGKVRLVNDYLETVTVVVNGTTTNVQPGQEVTLTIPSGPFSCQVERWQPVMQNRTLKQDDTYTIRIHPQGG